MKFHEWLEQVEIFSSREERLMDMLDNNYRYSTVLAWLEAAYNVGYEHAMNKLIDDGK